MVGIPALKFAIRWGDDILTADGGRDGGEVTGEYSEKAYRLWGVAPKGVKPPNCEIRYK